MTRFTLEKELSLNFEGGRSLLYRVQGRCRTCYRRQGQISFQLLSISQIFNKKNFKIVTTNEFNVGW